jgi:hypothetical protein
MGALWNSIYHFFSFFIFFLLQKAISGPCKSNGQTVPECVMQSLPDSALDTHSPTRDMTWHDATRHVPFSSISGRNCSHPIPITNPPLPLTRSRAGKRSTSSLDSTSHLISSHLLQTAPRRLSRFSARKDGVARVYCVQELIRRVGCAYMRMRMRIVLRMRTFMSTYLPDLTPIIQTNPKENPYTPLPSLLVSPSPCPSSSHTPFLTLAALSSRGPCMPPNPKSFFPRLPRLSPNCSSNFLIALRLDMSSEMLALISWSALSKCRTCSVRFAGNVYEVPRTR